ncbi:MAG: hypothetical protein A2941_01135 [Candidatus Yanofskybacteria bacterium RIFCSPLOWO2_01_FULL_49_17]|uniref:Uncharacterized protein n=1 Tax=Candidatus Yanofskybacteria bacterium RIFCSPLOWO2_01_FULL_49_17 TaxID=1802700 RepID=A0A1F8GQA7_9BACT|nr:MAG: hypothetical protein A2941_01135 [Candidatus Yanofskybacteria bacterium RIFCSPLOWO2_01_FULL_49_17]
MIPIESRNKKRYRTIFIVVFGLLASLFLAALPMKAIQAAALYFSPSAITRSIGQTFSVSVKVNTEGQAINAAQGSIVFEEQKVQVTGVSKSGSIFNLWTQEPTYSNAEGTINFEGGLPNPGYSGSSGLILTINFRTKTATTINGSTDVSLVSGAILANDGQGTNILTSLGKLSLTVNPTSTNAPTGPATSSQETAIPSNTPDVKSSTHPDSAKWYNNDSPQFSWTLPSNATAVSYLITEKPVSNPGPNSDGLISKTSAIDLADGTHYFHVKFKINGAWGPIAHFQFNIDTVPPEDFEISVAETEAKNSRDITFLATDATSGIDYYEVKAGERADWKTVSQEDAGQSYRIELVRGVNRVDVKAVDLAGNTTKSFKEIEIVSAKVSLSVGEWFSGPFDWLVLVITKYGLFIVVMAVLVGLVMLIFKLIEVSWEHINKRIKAMAVTRAEERKSERVLDKILRDMESEIKFLNGISRHRRLGPEEKYLKSKLEQYKKVLKDFKS